MLHYAVIFSAADPYLTGNYVPPGEVLPFGLQESKAYAIICRESVASLMVDASERDANFKCQYTFAFDTSDDESLYELQAVWVGTCFSRAH